MSDTFKGTMPIAAKNSPANILFFLIEQSIKGLVNTAIPVRVDSVRPGATGPVGYLSATPLVQMYDGFGNAIPATSIPYLPYARIQGGIAALIIDPIPGDIGLAIFCQQDISNVSTTPSKPASLRAYSMADGVYIGGILNQTPSVYMELTQKGEINLLAPQKLTITCPNVEINGKLTVSEDVIGGKISLKTHVHTGVTPGGGNTGGPQ